MFRCTLDELVDTLTTEFPILIPATPPDLQTLLQIINYGKFGHQEAMGVTWTRQTILLTDADTLLLPFRLTREDKIFPHKIYLMRLRLDYGGAILGYVPKREPRNPDAIGKHRIDKRIMYRASDNITATKLTLVGPGLGQAWLEQFR